MVIQSSGGNHSLMELARDFCLHHFLSFVFYLLSSLSKSKSEEKTVSADHALIMEKAYSRLSCKRIICNLGGFLIHRNHSIFFEAILTETCNLLVADGWRAKNAAFDWITRPAINLFMLSKLGRTE
jgi:hypothetical protein